MFMRRIQISPQLRRRSSPSGDVLVTETRQYYYRDTTSNVVAADVKFFAWFPKWDVNITGALLLGPAGQYSAVMRVSLY